ncbi:MAG: cytidine deaminase [Lachnospiraceae bacterium]|nr:cytidine deaminase [Lachnospiraceae bacterium]
MNEKLSRDLISELIVKAGEAREFSYSPYSGFKVGAALLTDKDEIYTGCNIENAAYSPGNCAERTAVFKAVSEGKTSFKAIAIIAGKNEITDYTSPCGICRQVLREFVNPKEFYVIMAKSENDYKIMTLEELFPMSFGPENLD